jgi:hypothetical protein
VAQPQNWPAQREPFASSVFQRSFPYIRDLNPTPIPEEPQKLIIQKLRFLLSTTCGLEIVHFGFFALASFQGFFIGSCY